MSNLVDIASSTDTLSNIKSRWSPNTSEACSDTEITENFKPSPRFMSPTISSRVAALSRATKRNSAPSSMSSKKSKTSSWIASAAKRVSGKSHKKSFISPDAITTPDKIVRNSDIKVSDSRIPMHILATKPLPSEKPLPAPPIAQVVEARPTSAVDRGIIDALEKPLTRSPRGEPNNVEEWPVLNPEKPVTKPEIYELDSQTSLRTSLPRLKIPGKERSMGIGTLEPGSASPARFGTRKDSMSDTKTGQSVVEGAKTAVDTEHTPISRIPQASVHKSFRPLKTSPMPRQTRTSNLRARLYSSNADKNDSINATTASLALTAFPKSKSTEQNTARSHVTKDKRFPDGNRAPAKLIAGSRRSSRGFRQASQGALQDNHSTSLLVAGSLTDDNFAPYRPPVCAAPQDAPVSNVRKLAYESANMKHPNKDTQYYELDDTSPSTSTEATLTSIEQVKYPSDHDFSVYEEPAKDLVPIHINGMEVSLPVAPKSIGSDLTTPATLQALWTETCTMKRLSRAAPNHGPVLWITDSADRVIMGKEGLDKENISNPATKKIDLCRVITRKEFRRFREGAALRSHTISELNRPLTSQGLVHPDSQGEFDGGEYRKKRAQSIDMDYKLRDLHLQQDVILNAVSTRSTVTSFAEDPFFDARSHLEDSKVLDDRSEISSQRGRQSLYEDAIVGESSWISPLPERALSTKPRRAPSTVLRVKVAIQQNDLNPATVESISEDDDNGGKYAICQEGTSKTPTQAEPGTTGSSELFPPRSSSRTPVPKFTVNEPDFSNCGEYPTNEMVLLREDVDQDSTRTASRSDIADDTSKCSSTVQGSTISHASTSKRVLSNVRGFFHKRASDKNLLGPSSKKLAKISKVSINSKGSPFPLGSDVQRLDRPTESSKNRNASKGSRSQSMNMTLETPVPESPKKSELSNNTALAMEILETARNEPSSPKKERLLELGKIMVNALTQARDAEKAMEEAKQAARKAEISYMLCTKSVSEITKSVQDWRLELGRAG
ncbi:hypothetical protein MMC11_001534 [Xylographa trunciseda]|nr:hypothetical protein [Xylographa trunciseda]